MKKQQIRFRQTSDAVQLAYALVGNGPLLVKVGSWLGHLEHDFSNPLWRHLLLELSSQHQLLRYDERGSGLSDWDTVDINFEKWVHDLETVLDGAGTQRFPLFGVSHGAAVAIAYAVRHPERVSHLVLYGGFARGRASRSVSPAARDEADTLAKLAEIGWAKENPAFRQFFATQMLPSGTAEHHRWFTDLARVSTSSTNAGKFLREIERIDVSELLGQVACPTLVMHATRDACVPFSEGRLLASAIRDARFVPLESDNHILLEHEPAWQAFVEEIRAFLPVARSAFDMSDFGLSKRELDVLELIARGCDNTQIAAHLNLRVKTVRNHITNVFSKMKVENRPQAIVLARNAGFGQ